MMEELVGCWIDLILGVTKRQRKISRQKMFCMIHVDWWRGFLYTRSLSSSYSAGIGILVLASGSWSSAWRTKAAMSV